MPSVDVQLLDEPVRPLALEGMPEHSGGECIFLGRTRADDHDEHGRLRRLSYEAYRPMAERVLLDLAARATAQYECLGVRIHHALGEVPVGSASVLVQVMCAHRGEAFDACRFLIDALKKEAPIWKREEWADGSTWSEGNVVDLPPDPGETPS